MAVTQISDLAGLLKPVFGSLQDLLPEVAILQDRAKFETANAVGAYFQEPLVVRSSWGATFLGTDGAGGAGDNALVPAIPSKTVSLQVTPSMVVLRDQTSFALMDRAPTDASAKRAFMSDAKLTAMTLTTQIRNIIEIGCLAGQTGFATVSAYDGATDICTITAASLRPGFLAGLENATVDFFQSNLTTARAVATAGGALLSVGAVDVDAGTFSIATTVPSADPQATDVVFIHGANAGSGAYQEMVGLRKQVSTQTGVVFNIEKATYSAYRGNVSTSVGPVSAGMILGLAAKAVNKGFLGKMLAILSPKAWMVLNSRYVSQQVFDSSYSVSKGEEGTNKIFISGQGVTIECIPHPFQADGEALLIPAEYVKRIGSAYENSTDDNAKDITFRVPGSDDQFLKAVQDKAAVEMAVRTDQQILLTRPAWAVLGTGITYTA